MITAHKADTCKSSAFKYVSAYICDIAPAPVCSPVHVYVETVRVQALGALPARLGSKQCLFRSSCLREMAGCARTYAHTHAFRKIKMKAQRGERLISGPVKPRRRGPGGAYTYHAVTHMKE